MKKLFTIIFLLVSIHKIYSQSYSNVIPDSLINRIIVFHIDKTFKAYDDQKLWKKRIYYKPVNWSEALISIFSPEKTDFIFQKEAMIKNDQRSNVKKKKITELFSKSDFNYMEKQFNSEKNTEWNFKIKKGRLKNNPNRKFYSFSIPLFSKDHKKAIFYSEFGGCSHCGGARLIVYLRNGKDWKLYKSIPLWDS
ncbi:hypothetical protein BTO06_15905 [Tenacibaculum sp. SZ-18]|uniref:hypothetical protein n=1 Tax=Tenacibaculum sp. SZ-18 TaxID=754423 RepID=UPI000C2D65E9|nr:hypothetical protein [Tenacibaculum sp. SZ-18]AUC16541.1 hypothetical protein BTO06_15905 [Tenacibaculum sp. SZ-18]